MLCTNGDKTPITKKHQEFKKLNFLKRYFKFDVTLGRYVGCLSPDTILNTIQWYDSTKDYDEAVAGKCRAMQVEAWLHSKAMYTKLTKLIEQTHPYFCLFRESQIKNILQDPDGYVKVMNMSGKDISYSRS